MALLALGNPLLDIVAEVGAEVLEKYGLELNNAVMAEERHQALFAEVSALPRAEFVAGGMVQNTARVAQWMLQVDGATTFAGCVGADAFADRMREACSAAGVAGAYVADASVPTGCCACLLRGEERALCTDLRAARNYSLGHLRQPATWRLVQGAKIIYTNLAFPGEVVRVAAEESSRQGSTFCMNLTAPSWLQRPSIKHLLVDLLPLVDVLFGNEREAVTWAETEGWETSDVAFVALRLSLVPTAKQRKRIVVITQGPDDTIVAVNGHVSRHPVLPLADGRLVDATGAGDAYAGGFLAGLWKGLDVAQCCRAGAYAASVVVQNVGCTFASAPLYSW